MTQQTIKNGTRQVVVTSDEGKVSARLYVNDGETATLQGWSGKTVSGAIRWGNRVLAGFQPVMRLVK